MFPEMVMVGTVNANSSRNSVGGGYAGLEFGGFVTCTSDAVPDVVKLCSGGNPQAFVLQVLVHECGHCRIDIHKPDHNRISRNRGCCRGGLNSRSTSGDNHSL